MIVNVYLKSGNKLRIKNAESMRVSKTATGELTSYEMVHPDLKPTDEKPLYISLGDVEAITTEGR